MPALRSASLVLLAALLATPALPPPATADGPTLLEFGKPVRGGGGETSLPPYYRWMSPEITDAWSLGALGQGVTITVVDNFSGSGLLLGNLGDGRQFLRHGEWTLKEAGMIAPSSTMVDRDYGNSETGFNPAATAGFDVLNLSYGYLSEPNYPNEVITDPLQASIVTAAREGSAFVSKAAGNQNGAHLLSADSSGRIDILSRDLVGARGAVFVGALDRNGSVKRPAAIVSYSTVAGDRPEVQAQFLVVGVESGMTGLAGTSFAAPIVSGYAAVVDAKFRTATVSPSPALIANRLLDTAREDTIAGYDVRIHGQGEASILNAIAPDWLE